MLHLVHHELGLIARSQGDIKMAQHHLTLAVELARLNGDRLLVATAYNSLGTVLQRILPKQAIKMLEAATAQLDRNVDSLRMAQVYNNLGLAHANAGEWDKSRWSYERSLEIKRASADLYGQAVTQLNVARVYAAEGKPLLARGSLNESAVLFEAVRDIAAAASARRELARLLRKLGAHDDAAKEMQTAVALLQQVRQTDAAVALQREFGVASAKRKRRAWLWALVLGTIALVCIVLADLLLR